MRQLWRREDELLTGEAVFILSYIFKFSNGLEISMLIFFDNIYRKLLFISRLLSFFHCIAANLFRSSSLFCIHLFDTLWPAEAQRKPFSPKLP